MTDKEAIIRRLNYAACKLADIGCDDHYRDVMEAARALAAKDAEIKRLRRTESNSNWFIADQLDNARQSAAAAMPLSYRCRAVAARTGSSRREAA